MSRSADPKPGPKRLSKAEARRALLKSVGGGRSIAATAISGHRYMLAFDGIVDWREADDVGLTLVWMSRGDEPVLICATVKEMDALYAEIAHSPLR